MAQMIETYRASRYPGAIRFQVSGLDGVMEDITGYINTGLSIFDTISGAKAQRETQAAQIEAERLRAEQARAQAGERTATLYVIGGLAAVGLIAVLFATR